MRIGIDARFLTHPQQGGFKTYTANLVAALADIDSPHCFVLYTDRHATGSSLTSDRFEVRVVHGAQPTLGLPWREQVTLPWQAYRDRLDLLHSPAQTAPLRSPCPQVVTIHDTLSIEPRADGTVRQKVLASYLRAIGRRAGHRAARVLTVSEVSKRAIVHALGLPPERVVVTREAPSPFFHPADRESSAAEVAQRFHVSGPFILHLGSPDGRKNTEALIDAYGSLPQDLSSRFSLVVAGDCRVQMRPRRGTTHFVGVVTDAELLSLYNGAAVFAFPSLEEGFGLPALEAMACGTPVVASDSSAMPEILGDAAELVRVDGSPALSHALARVLADADRRGDLSRRGLERAASYSWRRCAEETLAVYEAVGRSPGSPAAC